MKTIRRIVGIVICIAIIAGVGIFKYLDGRTIYNEYPVNGNTVGNLYGEGLFCEINGQVYFANPNDGDSLYVMSSNESNVKKVIGDKVFYINGDDNYLYYCRNGNEEEAQMGFLRVNANALCRVDHAGKKTKILDDKVSYYLGQSGNTLLYYHYDKSSATTLYSVGIDGENQKQLSDSPINPCCIVGKDLYYSGVVSDHYLHKMNIETGVDEVIYAGNIWNPIIMGGYAYVMDLDDGERIHIVDLSDGTSERLSSRRVSAYNVVGSIIYYQSMQADVDGIYHLDTLSKQERLVMPGQFNDINVTSQYLYFRDFFSGVTYHLRHSDTDVTPQIFNPPIEMIKSK